MINFKNYELAINILNKHVTKPSSIRIHADVDMDGIGAAYIVQEFLNELGCVGRIKSSKFIFIIFNNPMIYKKMQLFYKNILIFL